MKSRFDRGLRAPSGVPRGFDLILPSQYFDRTGGHRFSAEQRLMLALLADAINVYQQGVLARSAVKRLLYRDAERWIMAARNNRYAFSFETVCDSLGLDASELRRRMVAWKHNARADAENARPSQHLRLKTTTRLRRVRTDSSRHSSAKLSSRRPVV